MNARQEAERLRGEDRERLAEILQSRHPDNMYRTCERDAEAILAAGFSRAGALYATSPDNTEAVEAVASVLDKADTSWLGATYEELAKAALTALHELMKGERR